MNKLADHVLAKWGNRALAEAAAKRARRVADAEALAENARNEKNSSWRMVLLTLPITLPAALFYSVFLAVNLARLCSAAGKRPACDFTDMENNLERLAGHWAKHPCVFIAKATELSLYRDWLAETGEDLSDGMEIGVYTGETSRAFFNDHTFQYGVEYNIDRLVAYSQGEQRHQHLVSGNVQCLPFATGVARNVVCVHSVDDMELPAEEAIKGMARVTLPGGHVVFSGVTRAFKSQNPLIALLYGVGLQRAGEALYRTVYVGTFNEHNRAEWTAMCARAGLTVETYVTYVPWSTALVFDLAYRPEVVLLNLFGWENWLLPLARRRWFRRVLCRAALGMRTLSDRQADDNGIHFFLAARRDPETEAGEAGDPGDDWRRCPACLGRLEGAADGNSMVCAACSADYPAVGGIPVLHPVAAASS